MERKKLGIPLVILVFFILFINYVAMKFHWYSALPWFDMPMHFLGGFWVALLVAFILPSRHFSIHFVLKILAGVLLIGILWEIFEVTLNTITVKDTFDMVDTLSDLFFDIVGGLAATLVLYRSSKV
ncbi:MAG TPA: hypothetical protein VFQ59_02085 [Candidatus Paceibacterota bacterium]|nr:hypothetical protein [Candidatus Paceibacterota bacterium]